MTKAEIEKVVREYCLAVLLSRVSHGCAGCAFGRAIGCAFRVAPRDESWKGLSKEEAQAFAAALGVTVTEDGLPVSLVFDSWGRGGAPFSQAEATALAGLIGPTPDLHGGATFQAKIALDADAEAELRKALDAGFQPAFLIKQPEEARKA